MRPLIISAPFGNYVQPRSATATLGTFTALERPGRWWRTLSTVRYYRRIGAWVNRIGLRNPGIGWLAERVRAGKIDASDKIVSIHGFSEEEWLALLARVREVKPLAVELNMSCPNVGEIDWPEDLFARAMESRVRVIVKLPPVNWQEMAGQALRAGVRTFHCCNTLPVPAGGISGKPLKPVALQCIRDLIELGGTARLAIIGGGGITTTADIDEYAAVGASHVAIGTKTMNPRLLWTDKPIRALIGHAERRLADAKN